MRILILGGTRFVGRAIADACLAEGHDLTLFHRGRSGPNLFPDCKHMIGDRDCDLSLVANEDWDAVVDCCGYVPRIVRKSVQALSGHAHRYVFISTISVYKEADVDSIDEDSDRIELADPTTEVIDGETYGGLKALCEDEIAAFEGPGMIIRPGLVAGPNDPSDRFSYWVMRAAQGDFLVPDDSVGFVQYVDARDLASFVVKVAAKGDSLTANAVGPRDSLTWAKFASTLAEVGGGSAVFADADWLAEQGVAPWVDVPLWLGSEGPLSMTRVSSKRGQQLGLEFRPLAATIRDTLQWANEIGLGQLKTGLSDARHSEILAALREAK